MSSTSAFSRKNYLRGGWRFRRGVSAREISGSIPRFDPETSRFKTPTLRVARTFGIHSSLHDLFPSRRIEGSTRRSKRPLSRMNFTYSGFSARLPRTDDGECLIPTRNYPRRWLARRHVNARLVIPQRRNNKAAYARSANSSHYAAASEGGGGGGGGGGYKMKGVEKQIVTSRVATTSRNNSHLFAARVRQILRIKTIRFDNAIKITPLLLSLFSNGDVIRCYSRCYFYRRTARYKMRHDNHSSASKSFCTPFRSFVGNLSPELKLNVTEMRSRTVSQRLQTLS